MGVSRWSGKTQLPEYFFTFQLGDTGFKCLSIHFSKITFVQFFQLWQLLFIFKTKSKIWV